MHGTHPNTKRIFRNNIKFILCSVTSVPWSQFQWSSAKGLCNAMTSLVHSTDESVHAYVMGTIAINQVISASQKASRKGEIGFD